MQPAAKPPNPSPWLMAKQIDIHKNMSEYNLKGVVHNVNKNKWNTYIVQDQTNKNDIKLIKLSGWATFLSGFATVIGCQDKFINWVGDGKFKILKDQEAITKITEKTGRTQTKTGTVFDTQFHQTKSERQSDLLNEYKDQWNNPASSEAVKLTKLFGDNRLNNEHMVEFFKEKNIDIKQPGMKKFINDNRPGLYELLEKQATSPAAKAPNAQGAKTQAPKPKTVQTQLEKILSAQESFDHADIHERVRILETLIKDKTISDDRVFKFMKDNNVSFEPDRMYSKSNLLSRLAQLRPNLKIQELKQKGEYGEEPLGRVAAERDKVDTVTTKQKMDQAYKNWDKTRDSQAALDNNIKILTALISDKSISNAELKKFTDNMRIKTNIKYMQELLANPEINARVKQITT